MKVRLEYKVTVVATVDTEKEDVTRVTLIGSTLVLTDVQDKHLLDDAIINEAKKIADKTEWPTWDHEG